MPHPRQRQGLAKGEGFSSPLPPFLLLIGSAKTLFLFKSGNEGVYSVTEIPLRAYPLFTFSIILWSSSSANTCRALLFRSHFIKRIQPRSSSMQVMPFV